jgi:hypothetical protein
VPRSSIELIALVRNDPENAVEGPGRPSPFATVQRYSNQGSWYAGPVKVTIDVDTNLYRAVKVEAARRDRSVRDIVDEALEAWLDEAEAQEDRASAEAALVEYRRDGGESAESFFGSLAAETKATYGPGEA